MRHTEPPSTRLCSRSSLFMIGKDSGGHWVVQDQQGLRGGLFVDRTEALKFALFENGNRPQAVIMVPGILELNMSGEQHRAERPAARAEAASQWPLNGPSGLVPIAA
jgi:hypothetical protein